MKHWLLIMLVLQPVAAFADDDAGRQEPTPAQPIARNAPEPEIPVSEPPDLLKDQAELDLGWSLVRTIVVLGIVVALAWLTLNVGLRRLMGIGPAAGRRGIVSVIERVPLDQKRTLYVVKAGDEVLLLGASDLSVNFLSKLDAKVVEEATKPAGQVTLSPFLQKLLGKKDAPPPPPAT